MSEIVDDIASVVEADPIDFERLEELFDAADGEEREAAIRRFNTSIQRRLFDQAEGRSVDIDAIVPPELEAMREVVHAGQNTLPVFQSFQKRFCRAPEGASSKDGDCLWGYNEQTFKSVTGPGYFVAYDDDRTGEVCVDYRELPDEHPEGWPEIIPNSSRLGRFVYAGTVDRLRRVAEGVTIGRAFVDDDDPMNAWFVLVRREPS